MNRRLRLAVATGLLSAMALTGCTDDPPQEEVFSLDACRLLEEVTVEELVGALRDTEETSVDNGGLESNWAQCRYLPDDTSRPALALLVKHGETDDAALVGAAARQCEEREPLAVEGATGYLCGDPDVDGTTAPYARAVWGTDPVYYASLGLTPHGKSPSVAEAADDLRTAVRELMGNVNESSFAPR